MYLKRKILKRVWNIKTARTNFSDAMLIPECVLYFWEVKACEYLINVTKKVLITFQKLYLT